MTADGDDVVDTSVVIRLAARCAHTIGEAEMFADMLGLDPTTVISVWKCPGCGEAAMSLHHAVICEPDLSAARIHLLAGSITRAA